MRPEASNSCRRGGVPRTVSRLLPVAVAICILIPATPALAQGLEAEGAREAIIDAPVAIERAPVADENERIAAAISRSAANAAEIRRRFNVGKVDIVLVDGLAEPDSPLAAAISDNAGAIGGLRREIEGSAIFYHAVASERILLKDVMAVEFGDDGDVTIFVAAPSAG